MNLIELSKAIHKRYAGWKQIDIITGTLGNEAVATYRGGDLSVADFLRWVYALPPQYVGQLQQAEDEQPGHKKPGIRNRPKEVRLRAFASAETPKVGQGHEFQAADGGERYSP